MTAWSTNTPVRNIISQEVTITNYNLSVPSNAKYMLVSVPNNQLTGFKVFYGSTQSAKKSSLQNKGIKTDKIIDLNYFDKYIKKEIGNNLLNKDSNNSFEGIYLEYNNGRTAVNSSFISYIIPIDATQEKVSCNQNNAHICFFSEIPNFSDYDISTTAGSHTNIDGYISGSVANTDISIPENAKAMSISLLKANKNTCMVNYGSNVLSYETYIEGINKSNIIDLTFDKNTYIVDKNGNGDYTTISDAVSGVASNSTILVMPRYL